MTPGSFGLHVALWFAVCGGLLSVAGFAWMAIHDWRESRRRRRNRDCIIHVPAPQRRRTDPLGPHGP
jgi:hypothetical protein